MSYAGFNCVILNTAGTVLGGISAPDYNRREKQAPLGSDNLPLQSGSSVIQAAPKFSFSTIAVRALNASIGAYAWLPFLALDNANGIKFIGLIPATNGPGWAVGTVHPQRAALNGDLYIKGLKWSIGDVLKADVEVFPFAIAGAGATDPTTNTLIAAPTLPINTEQLTLDTATIGGVAVNNVTDTDISIDHKGENNDPPVTHNSGLPYPVATQKAGLGGAAEILLTITTTDLVTVFANGAAVLTFNVLNALGVGQAATGLTVTFNGTIVRDSDLKGDVGTPGKRQILIRGTYNGTTLPMTMANF